MITRKDIIMNDMSVYDNILTQEQRDFCKKYQVTATQVYYAYRFKKITTFEQLKQEFRNYV